MNLNGRHALVTGAAQGVGSATVEVLAGYGATVTAVDRHSVADERGGPDPAHAATGAQGREWVMDLADTAALNRLCTWLESGPEPPVDLLVNCAAGYPPGALLDTTDADWLRVFQVNVLAAASLARSVAGRLAAEDRPGAIVNVGSVQERLPLPGYSAYVASKGALAALTRALAVELGEHRIRVNQVNLGLVESAALHRKLGGSFWSEHGTAPPTLLGRTGTPEEAAEAIAFLGGDNASYITGAELAVDGGRGLSRRPDPQNQLPTDHERSTP